MSKKLEDFFVVFLGLAILGFFLIFLKSFGIDTKKLDIGYFEGKKILVIAPHPDDEIAQAGDILIGLNDKSNINILYITNGTKKNFYDNFYTYQRQREAIKGLKKIGIKNYEFLNFSDFYWDNEILKKIKNTVDEKIENIKPDIIFVPTYEGGHCVHDLTNLLIYDKRKKYKVFESAEYNGYINFSTPKKLIFYILHGSFEILFSSPINSFEFQADFLPSSVQKYYGQKYSISLNAEQKKLKKTWLNIFSTQNIGGAISDKFQGSTIFREYFGHDYSSPYEIKDSLTYKVCKITTPRKNCEKIGVCQIDYKDFNKKFKFLYPGN